MRFSHGNSSNFNDIVAVEEWFQKYVKDNNLPISDKTAAGIAKEFLNIVEDGRMRQLLSFGGLECFPVSGS